jgi:hypothetical protein
MYIYVHTYIHTYIYRHLAVTEHDDLVDSMEHIEVMRDKYARRVGEEIQQAVL